MDFKQIQELVKMINKSNISELSIEQDKFKITIKQKDNEVQQVITVPATMAPAPAVAAVTPAAAQATAAAAAPVPSKKATWLPSNLL
jgi:acetyl-CoA carboxylase biotin carboxyl carrier protein